MGRTPARITLGTASGDAYSFVVRPERRTVGWWLEEPGKPDEQIAGGSYRPVASDILRDMLGELLLIFAAADVLALVAWGICALLSWRRREDAASAAERVERLQASSRLGAILGMPSYVPLALFVAGTLIGSAACLGVLDGIPHVQDDVGLLFQGKIFALGHSWVPVPPGPEFFANGFIQMFEGRWFTKYPPGYPLLLVPGLWAGVPWLINPLSAGVAISLVYDAGRRMFGLHVAVWAALLGLLSPWIVFMSGSYMSHPTTMMWAAIFLYSLVRMGDPQRVGDRRPFFTMFGWPILAGFAIGMAFITREWTALGIGIGGAIWAVGSILFAPRSIRLSATMRYAAVIVGFLPPVPSCSTRTSN